MRRLRRIPAALALLPLALMLALSALRWAAGRAPIDAPPRPLRVADASRRAVDTPGGPRSFTEFVLVREGPAGRPRTTDTLRATLSLPAGWAGEPLPLLLLLGGAEAGRRSLRYVDAHGLNALLAYEYPYRQEGEPDRRWYRGAALARVPEIRRSALAVPAQLRDLLRWTRSQPWADSSRTALLGFSFGALFVPGSQAVLQAHGLEPQATVLAYGGADLGRLLRHNLRRVPAWSRPGLAWLGETLVRPLEPARHLPALRGRVLALNGSRDEQIPPACLDRLHASLPPGAEIRLLDAAHLHPRRPELTREVAAVARDWLVETGAANP